MSIAAVSADAVAPPPGAEGGPILWALLAAEFEFSGTTGSGNITGITNVVWYPWAPGASNVPATEWTVPLFTIPPALKVHFQAAVGNRIVWNGIDCDYGNGPSIFPLFFWTGESAPTAEVTWAIFNDGASWVGTNLGPVANLLTCFMNTLSLEEKPRWRRWIRRMLRRR